MGLFTFRKEERLHSKISIQELFEKGSSFYLYPFKVLFIEGKPDATVNQVLFTVSKRNFKRAVDRNKIKRRVREAFRLNKSKLSTPQKLLIGYIYTPKEILPFSQIEEAMVKSFKRLNNDGKKD
jgi:ribonuclease P protein component